MVQSLRDRPVRTLQNPRTQESYTQVFAQEKKSIRPQKDLYRNVQNSFIYDNQELELAQVSVCQ